jgi:hypothetical protein
VLGINISEEKILLLKNFLRTLVEKYGKHTVHTDDFGLKEGNIILT